MLSATDKLLFALFAVAALGFGVRGFVRVWRVIRRGRADSDRRLNALPRRFFRALSTTLLQSRTFRKRPWVSFFHSLIFYGFVFYLLVNLVDALEGFIAFDVSSKSVAGAAYNLAADLLSAAVLVGVVALVARRFLLPARSDFSFNERTMLHSDVKQSYVTRDSILVSAFILFHVGSRAVGAGAKLAIEGRDSFQPFASALSLLFNPAYAQAWRVFGYWGALGSVLAFLSYFPYSKHIHIFMAPVKYLVARDEPSGVLPALELDLNAEAPQLGAKVLEELGWPRLLDAYACIQCNRCQDVCPATATGKALSPSALEINKRMELNTIASCFAAGAASATPLLSFALSAEAAWACTMCGACIDVCPVGDEPMLDIVDIRRQQVMIEGEFPAQLQSAFRGMERAQNPWGISHDKRMDWAEGLAVRTIDENPTPDVLYWLGCAASYDPQSQKTARAFVQLLEHAKVDFAVLGKRECCTGDTARRAGNEYLYRQLADRNVATLQEVRPKLIVASCPHCMNSIGKEYKQLGGDFEVMHHTQFLEGMVQRGVLEAEAGSATMTYHDPCYLGRHNGVYDAPRNLLNILSNSVVELDRTRENSFCCGAGGAQFWKEEEQGSGRISDNRLAEVKSTLDGVTSNAAADKVLAVGCPFCKSMLESTPSHADDGIQIKDVAEILWAGVERKAGVKAAPRTQETAAPQLTSPAEHVMQMVQDVIPERSIVEDTPTETVVTARPKWKPKPAATTEPAATEESAVTADQSLLHITSESAAVTPARKAWTPKKRDA